MSQKSREAYRAIYLSSPSRFRTTLHAFTPVLPTYFVDPWQKDHFAVHRHAWRAAKLRKRGRWSYSEGPLTGVRVEGFPDPGLVSAGGLASVASRAQADGLSAPEFWRQLAERLRKVRDVVSAGDLATILDALVTAGHRHTDLLRTLTRELVDDIDKLSFMELAVVANAYAHFHCYSAPLLQAMARHGHQLLADEANLASDPRSLPVLVKAFARLGFRNEAFLEAANLSTVALVDRLPFADLADTFSSFVTLSHRFHAPGSFWSAAAKSVPGSRMASLCPGIRAAALLKVPQIHHAESSQKAQQNQPQKQERPPTLREALVGEIVKGLKDTPGAAAPTPFGAAFGSSRGLPAFSCPPMPPQLLAVGGSMLLEPPRQTGRSVPESDFTAESSLGGDSRFDLVEAVGGDLVMAPTEDDEDFVGGEAERRTAKPSKRWYNASAQQPFPMDFGIATGPYDASATFARNRRGQLVAEALEGVGTIWQHAIQDQLKDKSSTGSILDHAALLRVPQAEADLLGIASPVLRSAMQGLSAAQLTASAEAYALLYATSASSPKNNALDVVVDTMRDIVQESVRKLSNFGVPELRRLNAAARRVGLDDPYLERARRRRFPRALRAELKAQPTRQQTGS
eukprot:TRINITY_DN33802_c0_g1_i1.p1 TRINITY_DN33802_c0_g1~~TRINITY_DN33802_c0_g1_i1.p1  ORF type:complete len:627 (+),score=113.87 TRINITY_DN33802_c0_g1_i1:86-1966(+)